MSGTEDAELHDRWERRKRTLHIIDIENLVGDDHAIGNRYAFEHALAQYADIAGMRPDDPVIIGCHPGLVFVAQDILGHRGRIVTGRGEDGADLALLRTAHAEFIAGRFHLVSIGSGDHIFAELAAELTRDGVRVTVVGRSLRIAADLAAAAYEVRHLDPVVTDTEVA